MVFFIRPFVRQLTHECVLKYPITDGLAKDGLRQSVQDNLTILRETPRRIVEII